MPDSNGRFRGITVPDLPWLKGGDDEEFAVRVGGLLDAQAFAARLGELDAERRAQDTDTEATS